MLKRRPLHLNPSHSALQPILPNRAIVLTPQQLSRSAHPLFQLEATEPWLPQMPQLGRDARLRVMSQLREFVEHQPRVALASAQHHVAKHIPLSPLICNCTPIPSPPFRVPP